ncbi:MAG TPA: hypothetical protein VGR55_08140 [Candidatus Acidoferrum sp.]|nr:hypothetical protein [Candidatus Acidoferrum sp.]
MNRAKLSVIAGSFGFGLVGATVLMAFLADHHWYVTYQIALVFESSWVWAQLGGAALAIIGSIGMAFCITQKNTLRVGIGLVALGLLLLLVFGGNIINVHDWAISLLLPMLLTLLVGTILVVGGKRT